jgi:hypothetical protein
MRHQTTWRQFFYGIGTTLLRHFSFFSTGVRTSLRTQNLDTLHVIALLIKTSILHAYDVITWKTRQRELQLMPMCVLGQG